MAVIKIWSSSKTIEEALNYVTDEEKTSPLESAFEYVKDETKTAGKYISGINCMPQTALEEFVDVKEQFGKNSKRMYYHAKQAFPPDEEGLTPELAHQIGLEYAEKTWPGYQVVVTTHVDKAHLHNHFIINSVSFETGLKMHVGKSDIHILRAKNDEICRAYGLSTLTDKRYRGKSYIEWQNGKRGIPALRDLVKEDIDLALSVSINFEEFLSELRNFGYKIKSGKHLAVSPPGYVKENGNRGYIRLKSLNSFAYTEEGIKQRLKTNYRANYGFKVPRNKVYYRKQVKHKRKLPYYEALIYKKMYSMGLAKRKPKMTSAVIRKNQKDAADLTQSIKVISKYKLKSQKDLEEAYDELKLALAKKEGQREHLRKAIRSKGTTIQSEDIYKLTEEIRAVRSELNALNKVKVKTDGILITFEQIREGRKENGNDSRSTSSRNDNQHSRSRNHSNS